MSTRSHHSPGRCARLFEELMAYLDGELPAGRCARLQAHLSGCVCCATVADNVRDVITLCRSTGPGPVPVAVRRRARARLRRFLDAAPPRPPAPSRRRRPGR